MEMQGIVGSCNGYGTTTELGFCSRDARGGRRNIHRNKVQLEKENDKMKGKSRSRRIGT